MRIARHYAALAGAVLMLAAGAAQAWDTKEAGLGGDDKGKWVALYACLGAQARYPDVDCARNEHERLADMVLAGLIAGDSEWYILGSTDLRVVDLNASLYRPELRRRGAWPTGAGGLALEERALADPPHWAGIPDFSYSIYDWINKNAYCPPLPLDHQDDPVCHVYKMYHGGIFNSSHWAVQDELGYRRLHALAVREARRARALRESIEAAGPAEMEAYRDVIREAELLAMAYEGYAQHFLQDRWAMGHMWNRWGAPDHVGYPYWNRKSQGAVLGAFTGIIHGAEALVGFPDAMSSPAPTYSAANAFSGVGVSIGSINEMEWAFPGGAPSGGVGDYRLDALMSGKFGGDYAAFSYHDWTLNVSRQKGWLFMCSAAGWRQVIEAMGPARGGGYGLQGLALTDLGAGGLPQRCFEPLATNRSMRDGWGFKANTGGTESNEGWELTIAGLARVALGAFFAGEVRFGDIPEAVLDRVALVKITNTLAFWGRFYPNGTEMAQGGLPDWGEGKTSDQYPVASYMEPPDLDTLPDRSENGRDKQTIYGFFNRAHAGWFCRQAKEKTLFADLRGRPEPERRAACRYLADRLYAGTPTSYAGRQSVVRRVGDKDSATLAPLCSLQPVADERITGEAFDEQVPHYIHQGYVPFDPASDSTGGYGRDPLGNAGEVVGAWCDRRPILDTVDDPDLAKRDVVAEIRDADKTIILKGANLGERPGEIRIGKSWSDSVAVRTIQAWTGYEARFVLRSQIDDLSFDGQDEAYVFIRRAHREGDIEGADASIGRFVIRRSLPQPKIVSITARVGSELVYSDKPPPPTPITDVPPGEDPPDWTPPPPGAFRPVGPNRTLEIEIRFDRDMDGKAEGQAFAVGEGKLEGRWTSDRVWKGTVAVPADEPWRQSWRGYRSVYITAKAAQGGWFDGDPDAAGAQRDSGHALLFDLKPLYVERVRVKAAGGTIYDAGWSQGPDYAKAANWVFGIWKALDRRLKLAVAKAPPATGSGAIRIDLSEDAPTAPTVRVGGAQAVMTGKGRSWTGTFDFAAARTRMEGPDIPIEISVSDAVTRNFDADPRSPTLILPRARIGYGTGWWTTNEAALGGPTTEAGGPDRRHRLGDPPELSLVVILDKSGSMEDDGRIQYARSGVTQAFAKLPKGRRIEMAAIAFDGCGDPVVMPFTRDLDAVRKFLLAAEPGGSTAIARAHEIAADLFASAASPASKRWRYVTFTDGVETCGGDAAKAIGRLQAVVGGHRAEALAPEPEPPVKPEVPQVACRPQAWRSYEAKVQDVRVLPGIRLVESWYFERELADGRCLVRLTTSEYGVFYGSSRDKRKWGINSRPSRETVAFASSQNGEAGVERVRRQASEARSRGSDLPTARKAIATAVGAALDRLAFGGPTRFFALAGPARSAIGWGWRG